MAHKIYLSALWVLVVLGGAISGREQFRFQRASDGWANYWARKLEVSNAEMVRLKACQAQVDSLRLDPEFFKPEAIEEQRPGLQLLLTRCTEGSSLLGVTVGRDWGYVVPEPKDLKFDSSQAAKPWETLTPLYLACFAPALALVGLRRWVRWLRAPA